MPSVAGSNNETEPWPSQTTPWYSFSVPPVHFVLMTTEEDFSQGSPQYNFIKEDLAGVDRSVTPWVSVSAPPSLYFARRES